MEGWFKQVIFLIKRNGERRYQNQFSPICSQLTDYSRLVGASQQTKERTLRNSHRETDCLHESYGVARHRLAVNAALDSFKSRISYKRGEYVRHMLDFYRVNNFICHHSNCLEISLSTSTN